MLRPLGTGWGGVTYWAPGCAVLGVRAWGCPSLPADFGCCFRQWKTIRCAAHVCASSKAAEECIICCQCSQANSVIAELTISHAHAAALNTLGTFVKHIKYVPAHAHQTAHQLSAKRWRPGHADTVQ